MAMGAGLIDVEYDLKQIAEHEWQNIFDRSIKDQTFGILFYALKNFSGLSSENKNRIDSFKKKVIMSGIDEDKKLLQMREIITCFAEMDIENYIFLKGFSLKKMYRNSEARSMSDIDVFVSEEEFAKAKKAFEKINYIEDKAYEKSFCHLGYRKQGKALVELHFNLCINNIFKKSAIKRWYKNVFKNSCFNEFRGLTYKGMQEDDLFIHLIIHMVNHLISGNCTFKQIIDLAIFIDKAKIDYDYVYDWAREIGLYDFTETVLYLCVKYLYVKIPNIEATEKLEKQAELLIEYIHEKNGHRMTSTRVPSFRFSLLYKSELACPLIWLQEWLRSMFIYKNSVRKAAIEANVICKTFCERWPALKILCIF